MSELPISAVIFDLDGTLIDSKQVIREAYHAAHAEVLGAGVEPPPFSEYCKHLGRSFVQIMKIMGLPAQMHPVFMRESNARMQRIRVFEGVGELLASLQARGIPMAIATGKDHGRTVAILEYLGLLGYFSCIVGSDDVANPKPAPDMARMIVEQLHLEPSSCLFVGDALADLKCGQAAGMQTALALWDHPGEEIRRYPSTYQLTAPGQILALLEVARHADITPA
ncbi:HAD-IA family hydrolase [Pseudomonas sp. PH1b]|uniref:HAD-IA family hydrolase n=1 Tax=Pseudomonas sp. PH1b TaxID=1397282 RepID=UPI00046A3509|nr:HAD-IA family hydrolase [Pseudomonas sp. PH1b]